MQQLSSGSTYKMWFCGVFLWAGAFSCSFHCSLLFFPRTALELKQNNDKIFLYIKNLNDSHLNFSAFQFFSVFGDEQRDVLVIKFTQCTEAEARRKVKMVRRPFWPPWLLAYLSAGGGDLLLLLLWLPSRLPICDYTLLHCGTLGRGASLVSTGTTGKPLSCTAATRGRGSSRPALRQRLAPHQRLESRVRKNGGE